MIYIFSQLLFISYPSILFLLFFLTAFFLF